MFNNFNFIHMYIYMHICTHIINIHIWIKKTSFSYPWNFYLLSVKENSNRFQNRVHAGHLSDFSVIKVVINSQSIAENKILGLTWGEIRLFLTCFSALKCYYSHSRSFFLVFFTSLNVEPDLLNNYYLVKKKILF